MSTIFLSFQKYKGLHLVSFLIILLAANASQIDLISYFQRHGSLTSVSMDLELRSFWKRPRIAQILANYRVEQKRILEEDLQRANTRALDISLSLVTLRRQSLQQIAGQFFTHFERIQAAKASTLWAELWRDIRSLKSGSSSTFIYALPLTRERWVPADPYADPTLQREESEFLDLLGMLPPGSELTPAHVEMYLRCHRVILPSLPESRQAKKLFSTNPLPAKGRLKDSDSSRSIPGVHGVVKPSPKLGKIQKDLLFLLHPRMRNYSWIQGSFFKKDTPVHVGNQILREVRKRFLSQVATLRMERSLDSLLELKRPGLDSRDLTAKKLNRVEEEIFNVLEIIREEKGLKRFYYENLILKSDLNELPFMLRILSPQLQDFTLEALQLLYRNHGYSDGESGKLIDILEGILLKDLPGVGKEPIDLIMPRSR